MTSNASIVSLGNRSLLAIGARASINSLQDGTAESDAISNLYGPTFEQIARAAPWGCLRQQAILTLVAAAEGTPENLDGTTLPTPPQPWLYSYAYPSNCLQVRYIVPSFPQPSTGGIPLTTASYTAGAWIPGMGQIPFAHAYSTDQFDNPTQIILCNARQAQAVYTVNQPNPVIFDSLFEQGLVASLGAYLVPALSLDMALMDRCVQQAEAAITVARTRDGIEGTTTQDNIPDWFRARASGGSLAWNMAGAGTGFWQDMVWPG